VVVVDVIMVVVDVLVGSEVVLTIIDGAGPTTEDGIIDGDDAEKPLPIPALEATLEAEGTLAPEVGVMP